MRLTPPTRLIHLYCISISLTTRHNTFVASAGWLGASSWAVSMFATPVVVALCRRKSTRLTAVIGGLVLALGILFASFATQLHQVALSYGTCVFFVVVLCADAQHKLNVRSCQYSGRMLASVCGALYLCFYRKCWPEFVGPMLRSRKSATSHPTEMVC